MKKWQDLSNRLEDYKLLHQCNITARHISDEKVILENISLGNFQVVVTCRTGDSDIRVLKQQLIDFEYRPVVELLTKHIGSSNVKKIIDCGSNIGLSAIIWGLYFPNANITCIEPEPHSYALLKHNLASNFGDASRFKLLRSGLWHTNEVLHIVNSFRDSNSWAVTLQKQDNQLSRTTGDGVSTITLTDLTLNSQFSEVDLLKIDIEGGEAFLLEDEVSLELIKQKVKIVAIELHPDAGVDVSLFEHKFLDMNFLTATSGEYHIFLNKNLITIF
ncbi:FkbM family methyltransferase [Pontibacter sp. KCTC 32443]|uniref:FkbM family methyltransferase n=1 Tax=Pontibacter TaxID=323449 RepID=UPI00164CE915|nr:MULTISPECIES: FkbM family methyltransferase [Pontibacter]MBC5773503.1 FkbM family methyltransferase [Pontibacter sp. KCTC 32443]